MEEEHFRVKSNHNKIEDLGKGKVTYFHKILIEYDDASSIQCGEKVTFMKWGNALIHTISESDENFLGMPVKLSLHGEILQEDKDFKNTKKLTWLAAVPDLYKLDLVEYDVLINKAKVEENDELNELINQNSKFVTKALGTQGIKDMKEGVLQLERRGFYRVDKVFDEHSELFFIPDGKTKQMSTLTSKVDPKKTAKGNEQEKPSKKVQDRAEKKKKKGENKEAAKKKAEEDKEGDPKNSAGEAKTDETKANE